MSRSLYAEGSLIVGITEDDEGIYSGDGFIIGISKSTAYRYAKILAEGGAVLVRRYKNNKIVESC